MSAPTKKSPRELEQKCIKNWVDSAMEKEKKKQEFMQTPDKQMRELINKELMERNEIINLTTEESEENVATNPNDWRNSSLSIS